MLDEIYASIRDDAAFARLPALLAEHTGQRTGAIELLSREGEPISIAESWPHADFSHRYAAEEIYRDNPWTNAVLASGQFDYALDTAKLISQREFERSRLHQELLRPAGDDTSNCIGGLVRTDFGILGVGLHRPDDAPVAGRQLAILNGFFPHLRQMAESRFTLAAAIDRASLAEHVLDDMPIGIMLIDSRHRIHLANATALAVLREGTALHVVGGRLAARDPAVDNSVSAAITGALAETPFSKTLLFLAGDDGRQLALRAVPWQQDGKPYALITLVVPSRQTAAERIRVLVGLFGLTQAEARTAAYLVDGRTPQEIARTLGLGLSTVRTQIAQAKDKAGVRRTAELVQLLERIAPLMR